MDQGGNLTVILQVFSGGMYPKECISYEFMELTSQVLGAGYVDRMIINKGDIKYQPVYVFEQYHLLYQPKFK